MDARKSEALLAALEAVETADEQFLAFRKDVFDLACRYARIRANWALAPREERRAMEDERTRAHNALIDAFNILSRFMARQGMDSSWRADLGEDRKEIGDFACYIHYVLGIRAR